MLRKGKIYTTGFSGGSRVATAIAIISGNLQGVIGCGAGLPEGYSLETPPTFRYIGTAGYADFNFIEMLSLRNQMKSLDYEQIFLSFSGTHQWPDSNTLALSVGWQQLPNIPFEQRNEIFLGLKSKWQSYTDSGMVYLADILVEDMEESFEGWQEMIEIKNQWEIIKEQSKLGDKIKGTQKILEKEKKKLENYQQHFLAIGAVINTKDTLFEELKYWKKECNLLRKKREKYKGINSEAFYSYTRLLNYIGSNCYMISTYFLREYQYEKALRYFNGIEVGITPRTQHRPPC